MVEGGRGRTEGVGVHGKGVVDLVTKGALVCDRRSISEANINCILSFWESNSVCRPLAEERPPHRFP